MIQKLLMTTGVDAALITESIIQTDLKAYLPENGGKKPDARARIHRNPDSISI